MITVFIGHKCEGKGFQELINFVGPKCKEFILVGPPRRKNATMRRLNRFLLRTEYQNEWLGTRRADPAALVPVMYFQATEDSIKALKEEMDSLYSWKNFYPKSYLPEDLGFYRKDGRPILASITHEGQGWLNLEQGEFEKLKVILDEYGIDYSTDPNYKFWGLF